jgi:hypothetical protein
MRRWVLFAILLAVALPVCATAQVSVSIGQPGFYGRIDIGPLAPPPVIYAQPIVVQRTPVAVAPPPIYLHVPPGHAKNWRKHCHRYQACGQPVYFVQERWYNDVYVPHYHAKHDHHHHKHHGGGHGKGHKKHHRGHERD